MKQTPLQAALKLHKSIHAELQRDKRNGKPCQDSELLEAWQALHRSIVVTKNPRTVIEASKRLKAVLEIPEALYA